MIKGFYHGKGKVATIINHIHTTRSAEAYSIKYKNVEDFYLLLREVLKDADKAQSRYSIPHRILQGFVDTYYVLKVLETWGFRSDEYRAYWYRSPDNLSATPYEIVSGRYTRDSVLVVNNTIEGGAKDNLYIVRNLYKDVLTVTDSLLEAERYMTL